MKVKVCIALALASIACSSWHVICKQFSTAAS
ncbi:Uncharacterised protein [Raoultella terrigena]|uniref:Lipoprotein n=1 Tax=Raoultella terrigena TaxID=577 RepID=A0A4U9CYM3_RAOTE|nr:Uncharacterised protein [Raoultella terrigena]